VRHPLTTATLSQPAFHAPFPPLLLCAQVIILECTGTYTFALPLTSALLTSRFCGNWFNAGIYDLHIHLRNWPLLVDHLPKALGKRMRVSDIMSSPVVTLPPVAVVQDIVRVLRETRHNLFPIVAGGQVHMRKGVAPHAGVVPLPPSATGQEPPPGTLVGTMSRYDLAVLLSHRAFDTVDARAQRRRGSRSSLGRSALGRSSLAVSPTSAAAAREALLRAGSAVDAIAAARRAINSGGSGDGGAGGSVSRLTATARRQAAALHKPEQCACVSRTFDGMCMCVCHTTTANVIAAAITSGSAGAHDRGGGSVRSAAVSPTSEEAGMEGVHTNGVVALPNGAAEPADDGEADDSGVEEDWDVDYDAQWLLSSANLANVSAIPQSLIDSHYPHAPPLAEDTLSIEDRAALLDLRPYLDRTPLVINVHMPVRRAFDLFRGLGLRHLLVVNQRNLVVGILTRAEFMLSHLEECRRRTANVQGEWDGGWGERGGGE